MKTCMVQACLVPWQPLQNHTSGHLGGWAMLWSVEEMLDRQHQRIDVTAYAKIAHDSLMQKGLEEDPCLFIPHIPSATQSLRDWTELSTDLWTLWGCMCMCVCVCVCVWERERERERKRESFLYYSLWNWYSPLSLPCLILSLKCVFCSKWVSWHW